MTYYRTVVEGTEPGMRTVIKKEVPGRTDEFSVVAVLYEVSNYEETLDGTDLKTSDKIVAIASLLGSKESDWKKAEIQFDYNKEYDSGKKYKLAVVCSSSSDGDNFQGAPGSELIVRSLEIVNE